MPWTEVWFETLALVSVDTFPRSITGNVNLIISFVSNTSKRFNMMILRPKKIIMAEKKKVFWRVWLVWLVC